jgi:3-hydroxyacyl-CoA dehydrogenase
VIDDVLRFADHRLGKGVVVAKDAPGFIGNHIGLYGLLRIIASVARGACTIEEADEITGPALGRPKSATFRTVDLAGLDVLAHVVDDLHERLPDPHARAVFALPDFVREMLRRGLFGEKAGQGFYKRVRTSSGESEILTLDSATLEYRPRRAPRLPAIDAARSVADPGERVRLLFSGSDRVGAFLRDTLAPMLVYAARVLPTCAHSADDVDRVMRWGFGWEVGPFELSDAIGLQQVVDAARHASPELLEEAVPALFDEAMKTGKNRVRDHPIPPQGPGLEILRSRKERAPAVKKNAGASLIDLGDGVLCVEFHSKLNVIGEDTIQMLQAGVREASANFAALVVGNEGSHFSAGANLMLLLLEAQEQNWEDIDLIIRAFQQVTMALRYSDVPVVVAPAGLTLGGGCEIALHADRIQAAAESYLGLVELSVGLVPAGGGTKEMVARASDSMPAGVTDYLPPIQQAFETIALARVSASAHDAARLGYLQPTDAVTMNRDRLIGEAKARALQRVSEGYHRPLPRTAIRVGGETVLAPLKLGVHLAFKAGRISEYDVQVGRRLATIMAGGALPHRSTLTEEQLLDLEREAFLSLIGEPKTQERIRHTLKTGKALRN